jgi:hypothetical protein
VCDDGTCELNISAKSLLQNNNACTYICIVAVKIGRERSSGLITKEVADGIELLPSVDTRFLQAIY